jgi:DNA repair protein RecO (recombination protein O)
MRQRSAAICLRTTDFSETSQVAHFLTRSFGAVRLLAKGSRRPKSSSGGALDLLSEGDLVYSESRSGGLGTLIEFGEAVSHHALRSDARRLNTALYMLELADAMLAEDDPHPEVFDLLHNGLTRLGQPDAPVEAVLAYYQWRLLRNVGLLGEMHRCVSCGKDVGRKPQGEAHFSSAQGGLLCDACESAYAEKFAVGREVLSGLGALAQAESGKRVGLPKAQAIGVSRLLAYHVTQQLGRPLRMERHALRSLR